VITDLTGWLTVTLGATGILPALSGPQPVKAAVSARLTADKATPLITFDLTEDDVANFPVVCEFMFSSLHSWPLNEHHSMTYELTELKLQLI
jgi:hypothetical protein